MVKKPVKPTAKTKPAAAAAPVARGYEHGKRASGAKYVRPGFALTPELDLAFALGHGGGPVAPFELLPDVDPAKKLKKAYASMPRNVLIAELRGKPLEADPKPIDEAEAKRLVLEHLEGPSVPGRFLGLEALAGPSLILSAMLDGIEKAKPRQVNNGGWQSLAGPLKGMMLRVPEAEEKTARKRLEVAWKKQLTRTFDILLHGTDGIERSGYKYLVKYKCYGHFDDDENSHGYKGAPSSPYELTFLDDDTAYIVKHRELIWDAFKWKPTGRMISPASGRLVFLGGDDLLRIEHKVIDLWSGPLQGDVLDAIEHVASPLATQMIEKLAKPSSKVAKRAKAMLDVR